MKLNKDTHESSDPDDLTIYKFQIIQFTIVRIIRDNTGLVTNMRAGGGAGAWSGTL